MTYHPAILNESFALLLIFSVRVAWPTANRFFKNLVASVSYKRIFPTPYSLLPTPYSLSYSLPIILHPRFNYFLL
ncbi:hypothetical protein [Moorena producens]|uniref:hypothetical protein n=1 Tax=Moorena producens TaxID=1155739 RepID=UPI0011EA673C|nr:hypothetical protein [Moorena producens]